jgi:hypothetical protein
MHQKGDTHVDTPAVSNDEATGGMNELASTLKTLSRGIRMLKLLPHESPREVAHPGAYRAFNEAIDTAAWYVESFVGREGILVSGARQWHTLPRSVDGAMECPNCRARWLTRNEFFEHLTTSQCALSGPVARAYEAQALQREDPDDGDRDLLPRGV